MPLRIVVAEDGLGTRGHCAPPLRVGKADRLEIHGRSDPELFFEAAAAPQLYSPARHLAGKEHMAVALDIVAPRAELSSARHEAPEVPDDPGDAAAAQLPADRRLEVVRAHSRYVDRLANIALARHWSRQEQREGFDIQMRRWAAEHGSRRSQIGIADNYRMVPVYLDERIPAEVSRFYAHLPKKSGKHSLRARTGPSEEALLLRRTPFRPGRNRHASDGAPYRMGVQVAHLDRQLATAIASIPTAPSSCRCSKLLTA